MYARVRAFSYLIPFIMGWDWWLGLAVDTTGVVNEAYSYADQVYETNPADHVQWGFSFLTIEGKDSRFGPTKADCKEVF